MSSIRPTIVLVDTTLRPVTPDANRSPVPATFRYDPADPYATHLRIWTEPEPVIWSFARELLLTGLDQPAGVSDVQMWPSPGTTLDGPATALTLSSPDGPVRFEVRRNVVVTFLRRSYALVPRGQETHHQDIGTALARLLGR
jgi:hypothetical protein